ncbi:MAG: MFS transporter [Bdellovibrionaceae bacterium]|nr:MFS transporter [Pseudobdellovibrionaceae bacterium]
MTLKLKHTSWALVFAFMSMFILGLTDNIRGPLFPEILNYFNLTSVKGSWSFATTSSAAFIGAYLSIQFLKRYTLSSLLMTAMLFMGCGVLIMGKAPAFWVFIIGSFSIGISIGFMGVAQNLLVTESVSDEKKTRTLSALHATYGLASFIAPLLAASATNATSSWRTTFIIIGVLCFAYTLFQFLVKADPKFEVHQVLTAAQEDLVPVSRKALLFIGGVFAFYVVAEILIGTRLAQYMRNYYAMDLTQSSEYVTYFFLFMLIGRMFFAVKKITMSTKKQMNISLALSLILLILGLNSHPIILTMVGLSMAPFYPLSIVYISQTTGIHARKFLTFAMGFQSLAVVSMHLGVGYLTDALGLFYAFGVGIFALVLSLVCLNFHPKKLV